MNHLPKLLIRVISTSIFLIFCSSSLGQQLIYFNDFNQHNYKRTYKAADLNAEWNNPPWEDGVSEKRVKIETGYQAFGNSGSCLALKSPDGTYGTKQSGAQWQLLFDESYEEVFLTYQVKFKKGFDFVKGGKLPGLAGGTAPTGFTQATGYNGWTARMMWKTDFTGNPGSPKQKTSNAISYAKYVGSGYDADGKNEDTTDFTDNNKNRITLESNVWYHVGQYVRMNDPSANNGVLRIYLNNKLVVDQKDVQFRKTSDVGIDQVFFSSFFGGGSSWRTSKYETMYFDNFMVYAIN